MKMKKNTLSPCWWTISPACSPGWSVCSAAAVSTSKACAWPKPSTRKCPASPWSPRPIRLVLEQIEKQLNKLINVIKIRDLTGPESVQREMALICVKAKPENRAEILRIVDIFRCKVVDVGLEHYIIEVTGDEGKMTALLNLLKPMGIKKIARTGTIALIREPH